MPCVAIVPVDVTLTADNCRDQKGGICRARYLGAIQIPPSNGKSLPGEIWALGEISRFREESEISPCNYRLLFIEVLKHIRRNLHILPVPLRMAVRAPCSVQRALSATVLRCLVSLPKVAHSLRP